MIEDDLVKVGIFSVDFVVIDIKDNAEVF